MTMTGADQTSTVRLNAIFDDVRDALREIVVRHRVTWEEYSLATQWLTEVGRQESEIAALLEVLLAPAVDDIAHATAAGTESNPEGPFYVTDPPTLERPYVLPRREGEAGDKLVVSGSVRSTDGCPLNGAMLDIWQANGAGEYSHFAAGVPDFNLRGRLTTDDDGRFQFETVVPAAYEVPMDGATGRLFAALGRPRFRPGHIHFKLSHEAASALTTQLYFEDDPFIGSDVVGAVKPSLVTKLVWHHDDRGSSYATCSYDFVLPAAQATR
jgi:catechol 1,2-dioxygenase